MAEEKSPTEEADEERAKQAEEAIKQNEEEGQPQFPGDKGVAPDQADSGEGPTSEEEEAQAKE